MGTRGKIPLSASAHFTVGDVDPMWFRGLADVKPRYIAVAEMPNGTRIEGEMTWMDVNRSVDGVITGVIRFGAERFVVARAAIPEGADIEALRRNLAFWDVELVVTE